VIRAVPPWALQITLMGFENIEGVLMSTSAI